MSSSKDKRKRLASQDVPDTMDMTELNDKLNKLHSLSKEVKVLSKDIDTIKSILQRVFGDTDSSPTLSEVVDNIHNFLWYNFVGQTN